MPFIAHMLLYNISFFIFVMVLFNALVDLAFEYITTSLLNKIGIIVAYIYPMQGITHNLDFDTSLL